MRIEILTPSGEVDTTVIASEEFAEQQYPGRWRLAEYQDPEPDPSSQIMQAIDRLEREQMMPAATRKFIIASTEREALASGISLEVLTAKNKTYRLLKEFDAQINALEAQL